MANNVIDLDPEKRLTKEALLRIQTTINELKVNDLDNFLLLYTDKEGGANFEAFGIDWALMGIAQGYLDALRSQLLHITPSEDLSDD